MWVAVRPTDRRWSIPDQPFCSEESTPMKPWNTWVAWLASAGLWLGLAACGSTTVEPPPTESELKATAEALGEGTALVPPQEVPPAGSSDAGDRKAESLEFLQAAIANRGDPKQYMS